MKPVPFNIKLPILAILAGIFVFAGTNLQAKDQKWKKITDKNDIQVYRAHTDDSKIKTFKGVGQLSMEDIRIFPAMVKDNSTLSTWMHMISRISMVESDYNRESEGEIYRRFYVETLLPWPVKDRDIYVDVHLKQEGDYGMYAYVTEAAVNPPPASGYIRIPKIEGVLSATPIEGTKDVHFTYEMVLDPGGYIPSWLVNIITSDIPYFTLKKLKRYVEQEKYIQAAKKDDNFKPRPWLVAD